MIIKKIFCLVFCMLVIVTVLPISSLSSQPINNFINKNNLGKESSNFLINQATPGYMPTRQHQPIITKTIPYHPDVTISSTNDIVIQIIEEIDDSLVSGYLEDLVAFGPRVTETSGCIDAAEYMYDEYESMGLEVEYHSWSSDGYSSNNVVATMPGTDPESDEIYIVCGHYDTVSGSPGADDDGSGTITAMAVAYVLSQYSFEDTIRFIAWSGEEEGLLGSAVYAQEAYQNGENIAGVLNADMIGYAITEEDENQLKIYEDTTSEWLYQFTYDVNEVYDDYIGLDLLHTGYTWGSDHNSFWDYGYSALFYQEYHFSDVYHSPQDTIENMNIPYTTKGVKLIAATLAELAGTSSSLPPEKPTITGPVIGATYEDYTYNVVTTDPEGDNIYYYVDWGDESNTGWIGPYNSGEQISVTNKWTTPGEYIVRARAKDMSGIVSKWSDTIIMKIVIDTKPNSPTINGPNSGKPGLEYTYEFTSTDPENDDLYYYVDWDDGKITDWFGPFNSGEKTSITHTWDIKGTYTIKVKAKDICGLESEYSYLLVTMPRDKIDNRPLIQLLQNYLKNHPNLFPVFQIILNNLG